MTHYVDKKTNRNAGTWRRIGNTISMPTFLQFVPPEGSLPDTNETHALWYFIMLAHKKLRDIEKDVNYEVDGITELSELADQQMRLHLHDGFRKLADLTAEYYQVTLDNLFATELVKGMELHCADKKILLKEKVMDWIRSGGNPKFNPEQGKYWFTAE